MKLFTFYRDEKLSLGVKWNDVFIDVKAALEKNPDPNLPTDIMEVIAVGENALQRLEQFIQSLDVADEQIILEEETIKWGPAVTNPNKIICVGLNYRKHADETNSPYPEIPILFNKFSNTLTGHQSEIKIPHTTERVDYEVELGIVIGKKGKYIEEKDALDYVFGYCTTNDVSARDVQKRGIQWMTGKTLDGFGPVGPYLVTRDEIENPNNLQIKTTLNGEVRQDSNTSDMIFNCEQLISYISTYMTLEPGDLIMTGTPEGVILGLPKEERVYLKPGDVVTVEVEKLGALTNTFVEEKLE